uniref:Uncharacterized protein n=1 Tax=Mycena chlorophos TaxID=658473 RepID=A0ABQ0LEX9_MYCCL|nr:predicted protein [Mycena chlorophos]
MPRTRLWSTECGFNAEQCMSPDFVTRGHDTGTRLLPDNPIPSSFENIIFPVEDTITPLGLQPTPNKTAAPFLQA